MNNFITMYIFLEEYRARSTIDNNLFKGDA